LKRLFAIQTNAEGVFALVAGKVGVGVLVDVAVFAACIGTEAIERCAVLVG
jgi:hypothetical protein